VIRLTRILIFVLCLCHRAAFAQADGSEFAPTDTPGPVDLIPSWFARIDGLPLDFNQPSRKTLALELGSKLMEIRATYWEKRREESLSIGSLSESDATKSGRYFDLLATSSRFDGRLVGEGELAYSGLGFSSLTEQQPIMSRLGVSGRWDKAGYGASYRSFGRGFVSLAGAKVEHDRDENQLWGEYDFGLFRLRGSAGETWEKNSATNDLTLTRTAAASFHLAKPDWSAAFSSNYSRIGHGEESNHKTLAFANGFALVYRPTRLLTIEPNVNFRQERDPAARLKTDIPSAGLALAYTPFGNLQVIGRASYARDLTNDPLKDASIVNTTAGLNWKLGKSFLGEQSLSMQLEYKNEYRPTLPNNEQANLTGRVQFKIVGF
jgi:hypothetical protein